MSTPTTAEMDLSVVIASIDARRSVAACLARLRQSCAGLRVEFIVVDASDDGAADEVRRLGGPEGRHTGSLQGEGQRVRLIELPPGSLAPQLWAAGYRQSTGRAVAFTTAHCLVTPRWAPALLAALGDGAGGAGGPLIIGPRTGPLDWAIFFLRYAGFMPITLGVGRIGGEIAGDNAAYARKALDRHAASFGTGFWEVDFHRLVRADGGWLTAVPEAVVEFGPSFRLRTILRHRFAHGRQFGAGRVRAGTRAAWQIVLAAPAVPLVLALRAARRAAAGGSLSRFLVSLPWFITLAGGWALGEAWGALTGPAIAPSDGSGGH